jgi:hypothetical protein
VTTSFPPRYERIASLVLVVVLGLAVVLLVDVNPNILQARLGGDLPTITVSWLLITSLVIIASTGADLLARSHPEMQTRPLPTLNLGFLSTELAPGFWILPSFSIISSFAFFRLFSDKMQGAAFMLSLVATATLMLVVLIGQHYALDRRPHIRQRAHLVLQIITYLLAFGCFSAVYYARFRTLYSATLIGSTGMLLAFEVLQWTGRKRALEVGAIVGLMLAEATWALNYWSASFLMAGAMLLLLFYITVSLLYHHAAGTLKYNLFVEYGLLGSGLLVVIIYTILRSSL